MVASRHGLVWRLEWLRGVVKKRRKRAGQGWLTE